MVTKVTFLSLPSSEAIAFVDPLRKPNSATLHTDNNNIHPFMMSQHASVASHANAAPSVVNATTAEKTMHDSVNRKLHASRLGYFNDPFVSYFAQDDTLINSPLMNRGYWLRVRAVERAIEVFAAQTKSVPSALASAPGGGAAASSSGGGDLLQVVSLGAGLDTQFFKWAAQYDKVVNLPPAPDVPGHGHHHPLPSTSEFVNTFRGLHRYVEIDRPSVIEHKSYIMKDRHPEVFSRFAQHLSPRDQSPVYRTLAVDLTGGRQALKDAVAASNSATAAGTNGSSSSTLSRLLDPSIPTIVVAECVLGNFSNAVSDDIIQFFTQDLLAPPTPTLFYSYDAVHPETRFGQNMVKNLHAAGIELAGIHDLPDPASHERRCLSCGFQHARAWTMTQLSLQLTQDQTRALNNIERIDDWDEWKLVQDHYSVVVAVKGLALAEGGVPIASTLFPPLPPLPPVVVQRVPLGA